MLEPDLNDLAIFAEVVAANSFTSQSRSFTGGLDTLPGAGGGMGGGRQQPPAIPSECLEDSPGVRSRGARRCSFERDLELGTPGRNSQTDLMVVAGLGKELVIIAVEGKAVESFADPVIE